MARQDRLMRLMTVLRRLPAPVTAARLAEETEICADSFTATHPRVIKNPISPHMECTFALTAGTPKVNAASGLIV